MNKTFRIRRAIKSGFPVEINGTLLSKKAYTQLLTDALKVCLKGYVKESTAPALPKPVTQPPRVNPNPDVINSRNFLRLINGVVPYETARIVNDTGTFEMEIPLNELDGGTWTGKKKKRILPGEDANTERILEEGLSPTDEENIEKWLKDTMSNISFTVNDMQIGDDKTIFITGEVLELPMKAIDIALKMREIRIKRMLID